MPHLAAVDLMIVLIYFFFTISIGIGLKPFLIGSGDFLLAGRKLPGWLCGLAMAGAGAGSLEILAMGAAGARYGLASASFFGLGAVIPLLFAALFLAPVYYASKAKSLPGYLGLRFDEKTHELGTVMALIGLLVSAALTFYIMARVFAALRLFDAMFHFGHLGTEALLGLAVVLPAAIVLVYVALGGLGATMYAQVMQFFMLVVGFLPMVLLSLKQAGGWGGMKNGFAAAVAGHGGAPAGIGAMGAAVALGVLLTAGTACTDWSLWQTALAAKNARAARKTPLIAAAWKAVLPLLLVLPGVIAVSLPTPHTSINVRNANGTIFHEIDVVPWAVEQGRGLAPTQTDSIADPMGGHVLHDASGQAMIDYSMATPCLLPHNLPSGLLGLGLAALLACLTGGVATRISAFSSVFVYDVYQAHMRKEATEKHLLITSRLTTLGVLLVSAALAWGALQLHSMPDLLELLAVLMAVLFAPMVGTFVLGALWKRASGMGAFAGLAAGLAAALAYWGLTVPAGYERGFAGGWIAAAHHPASLLTQNAATALLAIAVNVIVTATLSLAAEARPEAELTGLVHGTVPSKEKVWWKRPAGAAGLILLLALVVSVILA